LFGQAHARLVLAQSIKCAVNETAEKPLNICSHYTFECYHGMRSGGEFFVDSRSARDALGVADNGAGG